MGDRSLTDPMTWVDQHGDYLFRFALLRIRDRGVAEEIVQETFLAALQARERFAGQSSERSWLVGIMKHKILDHFRKGGREQPGVEGDVAGNELERDDAFDERGHWKLDRAAPRDWPDDPGGLLERKQFWEVLTRCLGKLPPRMAQVFSLREIDEVTSDEICASLNITPSNLWVLLHRARKHLRQCLETHLFGRSPA
ncbi:MAG: sigma-70 family RNA polymerase sigma factor [Nitrospirota bacterium]